MQRDRVVAPISPEAWAMYSLEHWTPGLPRWLGRKLGARALPQ